MALGKKLALVLAMISGSLAANSHAFAQTDVLDPAIHDSSQQISKTLSTAEWMGPLAPIALSPFFGLAILSGIGTYGPEWLQQRSAIFDPAGPMNNPWLFWSMATLTVFTSLPRLSKVSKPIALTTEKLETYSAVIIFVLLRVFARDDIPSIQTDAPAIAAAGIATLPWDLLLAGIAAINIIVINAVKIFFEFLVWLTPFPFIDAIFEASNKTLCIALTGLYCFSPFLAAAVNLAAFAICGLVFLKVSRLLRYYRELVAGPILALLFPKWFGADPMTLTGFLADPSNGLPRLARVELYAFDQRDGDFIMIGTSLWRRSELQLENCTFTSQSGLIIQRLTINSRNAPEITLFHRRLYANELPNFVPQSNQVQQPA